MSQDAAIRPGWLKVWSAAAIWALAVFIVCTIIAIKPASRTVYICFATAGRSWLASSDCYAERPAPEGGYRYSPAVSAMLVPFGLLPDRVGAVLWRLLGAGMVVGGFAYGCRAIDDKFRIRSSREREWLWLLLLPLVVGNLYNGQANLHLAGLCLIGVSAAIQERWNLAAAALAAACYIKVYPVSLALLVAAVAPLRFGPRFALATFVGAALPFAAQSPDYVASEYRTWFRVMLGDDRFHPTTGTSYRDLSQLLGLIGVPIGRGGFFAIQCTMAVAAGGLCAWVRWGLGWNSTRSLRMCYFVGTFWMMLCGPATESSTYVLLAPAAAWLAVDAFVGRLSGASRWSALAGFGLVHAALFSSAFPFGNMVHGWGPHPLGTLFLAIGYLLNEFAPAPAFLNRQRLVEPKSQSQEMLLPPVAYAPGSPAAGGY